MPKDARSRRPRSKLSAWVAGELARLLDEAQLKCHDRGSIGTAAMMETSYCLRPGYRERAEPRYFNDADEDATWQRSVYELAAVLIDELGAPTLIDVGCGAGRKLGPFLAIPLLRVIGIDYGPNLAVARETYPAGHWIEHDLNSPERFPISQREVDGAIIVCADVIEHLRQPERLLVNLAGLLVSHASCLLLSTPERDLTNGRLHRGPPPNPCHVREWNRAELRALLSRFNLEPDLLTLTRAHDRDDEWNTTLAVVLDSRTDSAVLSLVPRPPRESRRGAFLPRALLRAKRGLRRRLGA